MFNNLKVDEQNSKMHHVGDIDLARKIFLKEKFNNLNYLLNKRFTWMNQYIKPNSKTIELGSGAGFSELFIESEILMTDIYKKEWINQVVDINKLEIDLKNTDQIILSHVIHHIAKPVLFLKSLSQKLDKGNKIIIQEIYTSVFCKLLLFLKKHEGWDDDIEIFNINEFCNDPTNPWSANCSIPKLLFNKENFEKNFSELKILHFQLNEVLIFPLSGGVIAKTKIPEIDTRILRIVDSFDKFLIKLFPKLFACGISVVLEKQ